MGNCAAIHLAVTGLFWRLTASVLAQSVSEFAVQTSATVQTNPAQIALSWPADAQATGYTLYRKGLSDGSWGTAIATLAGNAGSYGDTNVVVGSAYEYRISKSFSIYSGTGYIYAGNQVPLVESRGKLDLIVDDTFSLSLSNELARLTLDLIGDGWTVLRHDVPRMAVDPANTSSNIWTARANELANVKALIHGDYNADPTNVQAVFLFGHVPVPYSGDLAPDGHGNHMGAWPADVYYGDMYSTWTDSSVDATNASDPRNWNLPGDGKFDPTSLPGSVQLQVGRVDLANLPAFSLSESELLRQYLNKDHGFRFALATAARRGLIDDNLGLSTGEPFAVNGWRNFAPFFGASSLVASSDWFSTLASNSYLCGYGCGGGTYTSCSGVGSTADFATNDPQVVFTMFFGSYFGDWDSQNDFMRAALGTPTYTLTSAWAGRPNWVLHQMGLGETVGFSTLVTQNNTGLYDTGIEYNEVHIGLMGDPTLRMHPVVPPSRLLVATNNSGGVNLSWNASPDAVLGYNVYRAPAIGGPFARLNTALVNSTNFTDPVITTNAYMVRAVKLEISASGSYSNASHGIFQSLNGSAGAPAINLFQPTNNTIFGLRSAIQLSADTFDPANSITNVAFYANGVEIGETNSPPFTITWSNVPGASYALVARAVCSGGQAATSSVVNVGVDNGGAPYLAITPLGNGSYSIAGNEVLGRTYQIQFLGNLGATNWLSLGTATGNPSGRFQVIDSNRVSQRFYRSVYP